MVITPDGVKCRGIGAALPLIMSLMPLLVLGIALAGCQPQDPPGPTLIPTERPTESPTVTVTATSTATSAEPPTAPPTLRPMISATPALTAAPIADLPTATPAPGPACVTVRPGDTLILVVQRSNLYTNAQITPDLIAAVRALNGMDPGSNNIIAGQQICVPRPTPTPTPPGYEATLARMQTELPMARGPVAVGTYIPKEGENIITVQLNSGATLRELCTLNEPSVLNCAGCDLTKPIGQQGCRPLVRAGVPLNIPGPTPTPTITPTRTGSETPTPTPGYTAPVIVSPQNGASVSGVPQLVWLPAGILRPDEFYLVLWSDMMTQQTWQARAQANSFRIPLGLQPTDGQPHRINWQVVVAREAPDGSYVLVSPASLIFSFDWQPR